MHCWWQERRPICWHRSFCPFLPLLHRFFCSKLTSARLWSKVKVADHYQLKSDHLKTGLFPSLKELLINIQKEFPELYPRFAICPTNIPTKSFKHKTEGIWQVSCCHRRAVKPRKLFSDYNKTSVIKSTACLLSILWKRPAGSAK